MEPIRESADVEKMMSSALNFDFEILVFYILRDTGMFYCMDCDLANYVTTPTSTFNPLKSWCQEVKKIKLWFHETH